MPVTLIAALEYQDFSVRIALECLTNIGESAKSAAHNDIVEFTMVNDLVSGGLVNEIAGRGSVAGSR